MRWLTRRRVLVDLTLAALLVASFLAIPLATPHLLLGWAFIVLAAAHLYPRRRLLRPVALGRLPGWRATGLLSLCTAIMLVSGVVQWLGVSAAVVWHAGTGTALLAIAAVHIVQRRHRFVRNGTGRGRELPSQAGD